MLDSGIWKPSAGEKEKKLANSCEVGALALKAGGGAAVVSFYDAIDGTGVTPANLRWVLDASTTDSDNNAFDGLVFKKGIYAVCEQGWDFNPIVCIATKKYSV